MMAARSWAGSGRRMGRRSSRRSRRRSAAITGEPAVLHAAGRTDAGVHALAMAAHVDIAKPITAFRLTEGLNARLRPLPVAVLQAESSRRIGMRGSAASAGAMSTASSTAARRWRWRRGGPGRWRCRSTPTRCTKRRRRWSAGTISPPSAPPIARRTARSRRSTGWTWCAAATTIEIHAAARSFLHHQVRSMVGCLQLVGRGKWSADGLASGAGGEGPRRSWGSTRRPTASTSRPLYIPTIRRRSRTGAGASWSSMSSCQSSRPCSARPARWSAAILAMAAGSNQPSSAKAGLRAIAPPRRRAGPRNQAETGVTNPILRRWRISAGNSAPSAFFSSHLPGAAAQPQLRRKPGGELDQPVVEQRLARLQAHRHRGAVDLGEDVARAARS